MRISKSELIRRLMEVDPNGTWLESPRPSWAVVKADALMARILPRLETRRYILEWDVDTDTLAITRPTFDRQALDDSWTLEFPQSWEFLNELSGLKVGDWDEYIHEFTTDGWAE